MFDAVADAVLSAIGDLEDWGLSGQRHDQYRHDLVADDAALTVLHDAGLAVLSEESGVTRPSGRSGPADRPAADELVAIVDPVDGSTNASIGLPWFATSLCAVKDGQPVAALVADLSSGSRFRAIAGQGATLDGVPLRVPADSPTRLEDSIVAFSGWPQQRLSWAQFRVYGACALDLCAVARGTFHGFADCDDAHGVWDYAGAALVLQEAGGTVVDALGRGLFDAGWKDRRAPVGGASPEVCAALAESRRSWE